MNNIKVEQMLNDLSRFGVNINNIRSLTPLFHKNGIVDVLELGTAGYDVRVLGRKRARLKWLAYELNVDIDLENPEEGINKILRLIINGLISIEDSVVTYNPFIVNSKVDPTKFIGKPISNILGNKIGNYPFSMDNGFVYIATDITGLYKIGMTNDIVSRFSSMKTSNTTLKLIDYFYSEKHKELEMYLHNQLKEFNIQGEWFNVEYDTIIKLINSYE